MPKPPPPCSSLGLRINDSTIRVAVGLQLECSLRKPHTCHHCKGNVDVHATHSLCYRVKTATFVTPHSATLITMPFCHPKFQSQIEPSRTYTEGMKRDLTASQVSREYSKIRMWDATCIHTYSHLCSASATVRQVQWLLCWVEEEGKAFQHGTLSLLPNYCSEHIGVIQPRHTPPPPPPPAR